MYKDIITSEKIVAMYILMNKKNNIIYSKVFESLYDIITENNNLVINVKYIITDSEYALVNNIKKYFPNTIHISCYYHYKKDIISNIKKYGLYKKMINSHQT